jgi:eukaryotic-like serine/threonine-protein kinase
VEGGQLREARETLERAVALSTRVELAPPELARARFALARVLWQSHGERPRALSLAREAQAAYAPSAPAYAPRARAVRSWLSAHDPSCAGAPCLIPARVGGLVAGGGP